MSVLTGGSHYLLVLTGGGMPVSVTLAMPITVNPHSFFHTEIQGWIRATREK